MSKGRTDGIEEVSGEELPSWLQPGVRVVVISGRNNVPSRDLTIEKVGKRDVVLSNGVRFNRTSANRSTTSLYKRGTDSWSAGSNLYPAGAPEVVRARIVAAERRLQFDVRTALDNIKKAVRDKPDWDEVIRLYDALGYLLAPHRPAPSSDSEVTK